MNILFVDDAIDRIKRFKTFYPYCISTTGSKSAIKIISLTELDYLFLDHDLDLSEDYIPGKVENTGIEIVQFILDNKPKIKNIIVHSCNYYGSIKMCEMLSNSGYSVWQMPFSIMELPLK